MPLKAASVALVASMALSQGQAQARGKAPATSSAAAAGAPSFAKPGFETLGDGSTRLFVELSRPVAYETKLSRRTITYVLKDARVARRNSYNPLVTVHFNTPVTSARLVRHGRDLWFVLSLRAEVEPTVTVDAGKDGSAVLRIDLPKGDYLPPRRPAPAGDASEQDDAPQSEAPSGR